MRQPDVQRYIEEAPAHKDRLLPDSEVASLYLRTRQTGVCVWVVKRRFKHKIVTRTLGDARILSLADARKMAIEVVSSLTKGVDPLEVRRREVATARAKAEESARSKVSLGDVLSSYLQAHNLKPNSVKTMEGVVRRHFRDWLTLPVGAIDQRAVENRLFDIAAEVGKRKNIRGASESGVATQRKASAYLRALFRFAKRGPVSLGGMPLVERDPTESISLYHLASSLKRRETYLKASQREELLRFLDMGRIDSGVADLLRILMFTGLRLREALTLTWEDVNLQDGFIRVRDTKNRRMHTIPVSKTVLEILRRRHKLGRPYVLTWESGEPIKTPYKHIYAAGVALGFEFSPHDLRRTFATAADEAGVPFDIIRRLLNHVDGQNVTTGYIIRSPETLRQHVERVDSVLSGKERELYALEA